MLRRNPPPTDPPEFFLDRGLGKRVAEALGAEGWIVHPMFEVWPRSENRRIEDLWWLPRVTERGWVVLAKDAFRKKGEAPMIVECRARVFSIPNATLTSEAMVERFLVNGGHIMRACQGVGPFLYSVGPERLRLVELP